MKVLRVVVIDYSLHKVLKRE